MADMNKKDKMKFAEFLFEKYAWIYEREEGDCGIVFAETYDEALDRLREVYTDIDKRIDNKTDKWTWGLSVHGVEGTDIRQNGVFVTVPY